MNGPPYVCPLCFGRGRTPAGAMASGTADDETCRVCHGAGIVWPPEPLKVTYYPPVATTEGQPTRGFAKGIEP